MGAGALKELCADVAETTTKLLGEPVTLELRRYEEFGGVKVEVTFDEPVLLGAERRPLLVSYDGVSCEVVCYSIEEIVLENVRTQWDAQLKDFVSGPLPDVEKLLEELRAKLSACLPWPATR